MANRENFELLKESEIKIVPTLFSVNLNELVRQYNTLKSYFSFFHVDIMSFDFVEKDSYYEELFELIQKNNHTCEVHVMCRNIDFFVPKLLQFSCIKSIIIHFEVFSSKDEIEYFISQYIKKNLNISFKLACNPLTTIEEIFMYCSEFDEVLVMGVNAGSQGQSLIKNQLKKIQILSRLGLKVGIDGGVNETTFEELIKLNSLSQINIGSYLNSCDSKEDLERRLSQLNIIFNSLNNHSFENLNKIKVTHKNNTSNNKFKSPARNFQVNHDVSKEYCVIIDVGGTYTKYYCGLVHNFSPKEIKIIKTSSFRTSKELLKNIILPIQKSAISISHFIIGVAGKQEFEKIMMTHQNLTFNIKEIKDQFPNISRIELFNDCELAGYSLIGEMSNINESNIDKNHIQNNISKNTIGGSVNSLSTLGVLVMLGTGLGMAHISNNFQVYSSEGGHVYPKVVDLDFELFLHKELKKSTLEFDDILSSSGLELRYLYDTDSHLNSKEIMNLAFENFDAVKKTMDFFINELVLFLQDCIYFDNVVSKMYLGGEFLRDCFELMQKQYSKEISQIISQCEIVLKPENYLQFLGGLNRILLYHK